MWIGTRVVGCLCVGVVVGVARSPDAAATPGSDAPRAVVPAAAVSRHAAAAERGLVLDRLSRGDRRVWRAIEQVAEDSDPAGAPRSPTLRRLLDWARTSEHVLHIEMVSPLRLAGSAGVFKIETPDPAGLRHVAVIRLCPRNIQRAKVSPGPEAIHSFVRFDGLSDAERYAEVLAHELAHAEYVLASPDRLAEFQAAQDAIAASFSRGGRQRELSHEERLRQCAKPLAALESFEAQAQTVEAVVLRELNRDR